MQTMKRFAFVPSTSLRGQKKVPQPVGPPEPTHCLQPLDLFNAQVKETKSGVIEEQGKSELAQLCFNDISHEFLLTQSSQSLLSFFPSYLFHLFETQVMSVLLRVLKTLLSFDTSTSTSDFKENLWDVSSCKAKGNPFQSSLPVPKHCQIPMLQAEAFLLQKATCLSLYLSLCSSKQGS